MIIRVSVIATSLVAWLAIVAIQPFVLMNAMDSGYASSGANRGPVLWTLWASAAAAMGWLCVRYSGELRSRWASYAAFSLLVAGYVSLSALWAAAPAVALARSAVNALAMVSAVACVAAIGAERVFAIWRRVLLAVLALSVAAVFIVPDFARSTDLYGASWKGVFGHKNALGAYAAIACGLFLTATASRRYWIAAATFGVLAMAASASALIGLGIGLGFSWACTRARTTRLVLVLVLLVTLMLGAFVHDDLLIQIGTSLSTSLGRDISMTGRTGIWASSVAIWMDSPMVGFGHAASTGADPRVQAQLSVTNGYLVTHPHSGYLAAAMEGGAILFVMLVCWILRQGATAVIRGAHDDAGRQATFVIGYAVAANFSETFFFQGFNGVWLLSCIALAVIWSGRQ